MLQSPHLRLFFRRLILGLGLAVFFAWLALRPAADSDDNRVVQREFLAMGTLFSVSVYLEPQQVPADAEAALARLERVLQDYELRWRAWDLQGTEDTPDAHADTDVTTATAGPASAPVNLRQINKVLAAGGVASVPEPMRPLFERAAQLSRLSDGRFDVRIGALVKLWGFDDETHFRSTPPSDEAIHAQLQIQAGAPALPTAGVAYGPAPGIQLDFGAIAKGDATDLAIRQLRESGYPNAIVNAGGNLHAAGRRGERAWRIGVRHPRPDAQHRLLATLDIEGDEAVITSGDYERYFEFQGQRYHHILDPHTGTPARGLSSVTVVADSGAAADAASTALFVAGPGGWQQQAYALALDKVLVVDTDGQVMATPRLAQRLKFAEGISARTVEPGPAP
ncbi:FAD:protein FMN transferase [Sinimarinibacterium sp. CAU 1509]|uniref:FAD:protein FMN transferase n=1 Tax=Sinimarinibacterium sp. CAU 1509 TaxID=2562283 RepID=UPI0010AD6DE2|nr:FAD:protein FMN transferase [Sinimarinibacterium sp. CAU 1509]TJY61999.1 FAD:protein FMN transferase [Sinimarinibacterium sp. CAU 1509]